MGKEKNPRRVAENEAMAVARMLRTSDQKLNLVAGLIRGKKVDKALADLTFSKRRIAGEVKKVLQSAIICPFKSGRIRLKPHNPSQPGPSIQNGPAKRGFPALSGRGR